MAILTFEQLHAEVAAFHAAEAARNAPVVVALDALNQVRAALCEMTPAERADIVGELCQLIDDASDEAWCGFVAALAAQEG